jgi:hypothetical protein
MNRRLPASLAALALAVASMFLQGCATGVQPWQRANLADYTMRADRDPLSGAMADHIYFSREASTDGRGVGGGGCGCN